MRLLEYSNDKFKLTKDLVRDIPAYAILSHTWAQDADEVTFKDLVDNTSQDKAGYEKIRFCAAQTRRDGLRYFWVDTCCIDKSNNNELSEAINSMFRWYQNAARCYVYLSDVLASECEEYGQQSELVWQSAFRASRWFTRGWTLQELLAPVSVEFFTKDGRRLGDKRSLEQLVHEITGIALTALRGSVTLPEFDVEERFKWAETRQTTREEDWVYCLLGIFGVFMPLLYGEGKENAVRRLKKEITDAMNCHFRSKGQEDMSSALSLQPPTSTLLWSDATEISPLVSSIIDVSAFGIRLSKYLRDYGSVVVGAEKRLSGLDKDISFTSGILSELGTLLNDARVQTLVSERSIELARDAVAECDGIFQAIEDVIANIRKNGLGKLRMYFRETKIELLRSNLGRMKGNLTLLMGVINQATQILLERPNETTLAVHRQKIRDLMIEKEAYTQRYLAEKHKYDALLAKVNSTSTLGSISTTISGTIVPESSTAYVRAEEHVSSIQVEALTDKITPCLLAPSHHVASSDGWEPSHNKPLDSSHAAYLQQDVQARPSAAETTTIIPQEHLSQINESIIKSSQPKHSSRNKALKVGRKVAKGTGYVVAGTFAVAFFPFTIVGLVIYRRKLRHQQQVQAPDYDYDWDSQPPFASPGQWKYSSAAIRAELPARHELGGDVAGDLASVLTRRSPGHGRTED
ncbi:heterokaryon incompatibility protein-domain-containing protein [Cadophora sp. MPI-SDFR-AT-0126]|nr:heterokaryon incompatibility protein-domain-containing protein [Leotiomycetes sp. MPI-SDFR-AT-0126]